MYSSQGLEAKKVKIEAGVTIGPERRHDEGVVSEDAAATQRKTLEQK